MKQLSLSVENIVNTAKQRTAEQNMQQRGLIRMDGKMTTALTIPNRQTQLSVSEIKMTNSEIESMQQDGSLKICSEKRDTRIPVRDYDGNIYAWEFDTVETGNFLVEIKDITENGLKAIINACTPPNKKGVQMALEYLAQIKPIGSSEAKQMTRISYLVFDLVDAGISEYVVNEVCSFYRKDLDNKFFPEHAEFLSKAKRYQKKYNTVFEKIKEHKEYEQY